MAKIYYDMAASKADGELRLRAVAASRAMTAALASQPRDDLKGAKAGTPTAQDMGRIIGAVRSRTAGQADGALIAKLVKEKL